MQSTVSLWLTASLMPSRSAARGLVRWSAICLAQTVQSSDLGKVREFYSLENIREKSGNLAKIMEFPRQKLNVTSVKSGLYVFWVKYVFRSYSFFFCRSQPVVRYSYRSCTFLSELYVVLFSVPPAILFGLNVFFLLQKARNSTDVFREGKDPREEEGG